MFHCLAIILAIFRFVVIPVQFQDRELEIASSEIEERLGQTKAYLESQFFGEREYIFHIAGTVTVPKNLDHYGHNGEQERDFFLYECAISACQLADGEVDFSQYDNSGKGMVDAVILFCAGPSEDSGAGEDYIWPQQSRINSKSAIPVFHDGKRIDSYVAIPESCNFGTICHEMGHVLGLPDLYDTDGVASGGISIGLWGSTALMDQGGRNADGLNPSNFCAVERHLVGVGRTDTLSTGHWRMEPAGKQAQQLLVTTQKEGRYLMVECRDNSGRDSDIGGCGLLLTLIDRSPEHMPLWDGNRVNCNPAKPGASVICANPEAKNVSEIFFPQPGRTAASLGEYGTPLSVIGIIRNGDGSVEFDAVEPIQELQAESFQDAAIISWKLDPAIGLDAKTTLCWKMEGEEEMHETEVGGGEFCTLEGLEPHRGYSIVVKAVGNGGEVFTAASSFRTKSLIPGTRPYIYLNGTERNPDGSFVQGARIPLRLNNATGITGIEWFLDNQRIRTESDGYYHIAREGTLRAKLSMEDGSTAVISKKISIR